MSLAVDMLPALNILQISQDGQLIFIPRDEVPDLIAKLMVAAGGTLPDPDFSRKVPEPVLRVVDAFYCVPDPSCGQDSS